MIILEVQPYCDNCLNFQADVERPHRFYANGQLLEIEQTDTIVRCEDRNKCERMIQYLRRKDHE